MNRKTSPRKILLVDDEENVLKALSRRISSVHPEWLVFEATGGREGLAVLNNNACELVVSDMHMPGMDGLEFLTKVRERFPQTVRLALSGNAERETTLRGISLAHQYFSKPCDTQLLIATMEESLKSVGVFDDWLVKGLVARLSRFLPLPPQCEGIVQAMRGPGSLGGMEDVAALERGLSARALELCNDPLWGHREAFKTLHDAAAFLGADAVRAAALLCSFLEFFAKSKSLPPALGKNVLARGIQVGVAAAKVSEKYFNAPLMKSRARASGLLHDSGRLVLAYFFPEQYKSIMEVSQKTRVPLWRLEKGAFKVTHATAGAMIFELWALPKDVCEVIHWHHEPSAHMVIAPDALLSSLHIADGIDMRAPSQEDCLPGGLDATYLQKAGLPGEGDFWSQWFQKN